VIITHLLFNDKARAFEKYGESIDLISSPIISNTNSLAIRCIPSYKSTQRYIGIYKIELGSSISKQKFCSLDIDSASYIGYEDEDLILTDRDIDTIVELLHKDNEIHFMEIQPQNTIRSKGITNWNGLLAYYNWVMESDFDINVCIPDYTKLIKAGL